MSIFVSMLPINPWILPAMWCFKPYSNAVIGCYLEGDVHVQVKPQPLLLNPPFICNTTLMLQIKNICSWYQEGMKELEYSSNFQGHLSMEALIAKQFEIDLMYRLSYMLIQIWLHKRKEVSLVYFFFSQVSL